MFPDVISYARGNMIQATSLASLISLVHLAFKKDACFKYHRNLNNVGQLSLSVYEALFVFSYSSSVF